MTTKLSPKAEALRERLADETGEHDKGMRALAARDIARTIVEELKLAEPEMHVPNALAHKLLPLLELAKAGHEDGGS